MKYFLYHKKKWFVLLALLALPALNGISSESKKNKIVYLDIEEDMTDGESLFAGLVIEDKVEVPKIEFDNTLEPVPQRKIELSPSLREYITRQERDLPEKLATPSK